jgi:hypothetical protein
MFDHDIGEDTTTHVEFGSEAHIFRFYSGHHIIKNSVRDSFVKRILVSIRPDIELETFKLNAFFVRDIIKNQNCKVGLSSFGA